MFETPNSGNKQNKLFTLEPTKLKTKGLRVVFFLQITSYLQYTKQQNGYFQTIHR